MNRRNLQKKLDYKIQVLTIAKNIFNADETKQDRENWKDYDGPNEQGSSRYVPVLCVLGDQA